MAYDKVIDSAKLDADLTTVADAIRSKGGTTEEMTFPNGFVSAIEAIETGGGEVNPPTPDDGKTRVYIHLEYGRTSPMMGVCPNGTVTVDWGDGTEPDILTGTSTSTVKWTPTHSYSEPGDYVIALTVDGEMGFYGSSTTDQYSGILRYSSGADSRNRAYQNAVKKVEIGAGVTSIGSNTFFFCYSLESMTIPDSVTSIGGSAFQNCYSLASVVIPEGVTSIGNFAFWSCYSLASVVIPNSVTSIGDDAFYSCYSLESMTIPDSVTSIGRGAFYSCYCVCYYDFTACTSVPTLSNADAFKGIVADCEMLIPAALYDEWSTATNWATYASYMVAV